MAFQYGNNDIFTNKSDPSIYRNNFNPAYVPRSSASLARIVLESSDDEDSFSNHSIHHRNNTSKQHEFLDTLESAANDIKNIILKLNNIIQEDESNSLNSVQSQLNTLHSVLVKHSVNKRDRHANRTNSNVLVSKRTKNITEIDEERVVDGGVRSFRQTDISKVHEVTRKKHAKPPPLNIGYIDHFEIKPIDRDDYYKPIHKVSPSLRGNNASQSEQEYYTSNSQPSGGKQPIMVPRVQTRQNDRHYNPQDGRTNGYSLLNQQPNKNQSAAYPANSGFGNNLPADLNSNTPNAQINITIAPNANQQPNQASTYPPGDSIFDGNAFYESSLQEQNPHGIPLFPNQTCPQPRGPPNGWPSTTPISTAQQSYPTNPSNIIRNSFQPPQNECTQPVPNYCDFARTTGTQSPLRVETNNDSMRNQTYNRPSENYSQIVNQTTMAGEPQAGSFYPTYWRTSQINDIPSQQQAPGVYNSPQNNSCGEKSDAALTQDKRNIGYYQIKDLSSPQQPTSAPNAPKRNLIRKQIEVNSLALDEPISDSRDYNQIKGRHLKLPNPTRNTSKGSAIRTGQPTKSEIQQNSTPSRRQSATKTKFNLNETPFELIKQAYGITALNMTAVENFFGMLKSVSEKCDWDDILLCLIDNISNFTAIKIFNRCTLEELGHFNLPAREMEDVYASGLLDLFLYVRNRNLQCDPGAINNFTPSVVQMILYDLEHPGNQSYFTKQFIFLKVFAKMFLYILRKIHFRELFRHLFVGPCLDEPFMEAVYTVSEHLK